jgi:hypothetical protein
LSKRTSATLSLVASVVGLYKCFWIKYETFY